MSFGLALNQPLIPHINSSSQRGIPGGDKGKDGTEWAGLRLGGQVQPAEAGHTLPPETNHHDWCSQPLDSSCCVLPG